MSRLRHVLCRTTETRRLACDPIAWLTGGHGGGWGTLYETTPHGGLGRWGGRVGLLAACLAFGGGCGRDPIATPDHPSDDELAVALERSAAYFSHQVLVGDQVWMAKQGAWLLGGEFEPWARALFVERRVLRGTGLRLVDLGDRVDPRPTPLPVPDVEPVPDPIYRLSDREMNEIRAMMDLSSRCRELGDAGRERLLAEISRPGRSYVVTHQLWALTTSHHQGCVDATTFERLRPVLATSVYRELVADTAFNDLMAERMAMLSYAGLASWVPDAAVDLALATQHPSGVWLRHQVDIGPFATSNVMHMSTLAFYALAAAQVHREESR